MYIEKGVTVQKRFALFNSYISRKQPLPLAWAVAFLMFMYSGGLYDTDYRDDDADNRHNNTDNTDDNT